LRRQIEDPAAELSQITGKKPKHEFKRLLAEHDPKGKFRNAFLEQTLYS